MAGFLHLRVLPDQQTEILQRMREGLDARHAHHGRVALDGVQRALHRAQHLFLVPGVGVRLFQPQDQARHLARQRPRLLDEVLVQGCEQLLHGASLFCAS